MRMKHFAAAILICAVLASCSNGTQKPSGSAGAEEPPGPAVEDGQNADDRESKAAEEQKEKAEREALEQEARLQAEAEMEAERKKLDALSKALDNAPLLDAESGALRKFPYPYSAMVSITSDSDSTTVETFERTHRFLNTFEDTPYGKGLGLDIADSFFVYNGSNYESADNLLAYCAGINPNELQDAALIKKYYDCGWIDSIHAFGDFSRKGKTRFTRELAISAWEMLDEAGIRPTVWIDHGTDSNVQNFGAYNPKNASSYQMGDNPDSEYYHTDVTLAGSIRYVWYSRHSGQFGYDFPLSPKTLRDGQTVWIFCRYTSELKPNGVIDWTWKPNRLRDQITEKRLDALEEKGQYSVIAQHITSFQDEYQPQESDIAALRLLADRFHQKRSILVARTSRLLSYAVAQKYVSYQMAESDGQTGIRIVSVLDPATGPRDPRPEELAGMTFYCDNPEKALIFIGNTQLAPDAIQRNGEDSTGRKSVSIPWFDQDTLDYTGI